MWIQSLCGAKRRMTLMAMFAVGMMAMSARADDPKPGEKPADPPPPAVKSGGDTAARPDPAQMLKQMRERLNQLNLTDDQKKTADEACASATEELKKLSTSDPQERRQGMMKIMKDVREKMAAVLTDEQKQKWQELTAGGRGGVGGGQRIQAVLEKLDLTADQKEKIKPVLADFAAKVQELRNQAGGDRAAMREKVTAAMNDLRDKLKEILTPDQQEKFRAALQESRGNANPPAKPADK